ncbi:C40 family peptidase [Terrisporobacter petrolearius]|uniref:C40 family peptidase n=1 Tax=Terrisporobacter petrolearius TaxID=1460447 RepID=UPI001D162C58|nr:C40 family peptidase [Terrisporobacter petrolearius]MCC3866079.1 C40 family peptidase [Terrisporobacter petrolearius]
MKNFKRKLITLLLLVTMIMPVLTTPTQIDAASKSSKSTKVVSFAKKQLGKKYVWGKSGPSAFDCSGFTYYTIKKTTGKSISRTSITQSKQGKYVSRKKLKKGDLVFFATTGKGRVSHAGIYIGNKKFIHASSTKGKVVISSMASGHYYKTFVNGRRVI